MEHGRIAAVAGVAALTTGSRQQEARLLADGEEAPSGAAVAGNQRTPRLMLWATKGPRHGLAAVAGNETHPVGAAGHQVESECRPYGLRVWYSQSHSGRRRGHAVADSHLAATP